MRTARSIGIYLFALLLTVFTACASREQPIEPREEGVNSNGPARQEPVAPEEKP